MLVVVTSEANNARSGMHSIDLRLDDIPTYTYTSIHVRRHKNIDHNPQEQQRQLRLCPIEHRNPFHNIHDMDNGIVHSILQ